MLSIWPYRHTKDPVFSRAEQHWCLFHTQHFSCITPAFERQKPRRFWFAVQGPWRAAVTVECATHWLCVFSVASEWRSQYSLISVLIFLQLQRYGLKLRYLWQLLWEISCYSELFVRRVSFERFDLSRGLVPIETLAFSLRLRVRLFCPSVSESLSSKTWDTKIPLSFCLCNSVPDPT